MYSLAVTAVHLHAARTSAACAWLAAGSAYTCHIGPRSRLHAPQPLPPSWHTACKLCPLPTRPRVHGSTHPAAAADAVLPGAVLASQPASYQSVWSYIHAAPDAYPWSTAGECRSVIARKFRPNYKLRLEVQVQRCYLGRSCGRHCCRCCRCLGQPSCPRRSCPRRSASPSFSQFLVCEAEELSMLRVNRISLLSNQSLTHAHATTSLSGFSRCFSRKSSRYGRLASVRIERAPAGLPHHMTHRTPPPADSKPVNEGRHPSSHRRSWMQDIFISSLFVSDFYAISCIIGPLEHMVRTGGCKISWVRAD